MCSSDLLCCRGSDGSAVIQERHGHEVITEEPASDPRQWKYALWPFRLVSGDQPEGLVAKRFFEDRLPAVPVAERRFGTREQGIPRRRIALEGRDLEFGVLRRHRWLCWRIRRGIGHAVRSPVRGGRVNVARQACQIRVFPRSAPREAHGPYDDRQIASSKVVAPDHGSRVDGPRRLDHTPAGKAQVARDRTVDRVVPDLRNARIGGRGPQRRDV